MKILSTISTKGQSKPSSALKASCIIIPLSILPNVVSAMPATIVVSATEVLHFGTFAVTNTGTVVVDTAGARSSTGGITLVPGAGLESQGIISISGSTGLLIDFSMVGTSFVLSNGGDTMTVDSFQLVTTGGGVSETISLTTTPQTFGIGATLNVNNATQPDGTYVGNYSIQANYQ